MKNISYVMLPQSVMLQNFETFRHILYNSIFPLINSIINYIFLTSLNFSINETFQTLFDTVIIFYFLQSEIILFMFIIEFITSILTKNHTINIFSVNFATFIQFTVM